MIIRKKEAQTTPASTPAPDPEAVGEICCEIDPESRLKGAMPRRARAARAVAGLMFLAAAGALATRQTPGGIALWPLASVPAWFGVSHLVAAQMGYRGCPEIGAIASVLNGRVIETACIPWDRTDRLLGIDPY